MARRLDVHMGDQSQARLREELWSMGCPWNDRRKALAGAIAVLRMLWMQQEESGAWVMHPYAENLSDVACVVILLDQMAAEDPDPAPPMPPEERKDMERWLEQADAEEENPSGC